MQRTKRDLATINPRFAKPAFHRHRVHFNKRTLDRLFAAWRYGLLDEGHLVSLLGSYGRHAHRELELARAGLIYHPEAQVPLRAVCNNITWITALTHLGADQLAARGYRIDPTQHRERYRRHKSYNSILHDLNRSDYLIALQAAVARHSTVLSEGQLDAFVAADNEEGSDRPLQRLSMVHQDEIFGLPYTETVSFSSMAVWKREHRPVTVEPDGYVALRKGRVEDDQCTKYFALEIDQDTEANVRHRNFWTQKSILKTMITYGEAHRRRIIETKLGLPNMRTIFVTTSERHVSNIFRNAAPMFLKAGYPPNLILFCSREALEHTDPLSVAYKNAAGRDVSLLD